MSAPAARINQFRGAVVAAIRAAMPALRSCEEQFGRFDLDELERTVIPSPAVRVAVLRAKAKPLANGQGEATLSCAAFVVTDGNERDARAWAIAEAIAALLHTSQLWGLTQLEAPQAVEIQPVVGLKLRQRAVAIIAVEWTQSLRRLGADVFGEDGTVVEGLYLGEELVAAPTPPDEEPEAGDDE
ncbi:MAG: hypothetical protein IH590_04305 [Aquamicrobium sp.]|nr:hypothetical protein [Aquamicrobium sp.]